MKLLPTATEINCMAGDLGAPDERAFATAFQQQSQGEQEGSRWGLLTQVFNIHLRPENAREPFGPMAVFEGKRSMIPSDLSSEERTYLRSLLDETLDPEVQARLGDVLWVAGRDAQAARIAIRGYLASGRRLEHPDHWVPAMERYERAVRLAHTIGRQGDLAKETLQHMHDRVIALNGLDNSYLSQRLLTLLEEFRFGDFRALADIGLRIAERHRSAGAFYLAREYYGVTARLTRRVGNATAEAAARKAAAETFVEQAEAAETQGNYMLSQNLWEQSIQALRRFPDEKARLPELHRRLNAAGKENLKLMRPIEASIDLTQQVEAVRKALAGLPMKEALLKLAFGYSLLAPDDLRTQVQEAVKKTPLWAMMPSVTTDAQGRTIHKSPGLMASGPEELEKAIRAKMEEFASLHRSYVCHAYIGPAMQQLLEDHFINDEDLAGFLSSSAFIPDDRSDLFVAGLAAGFRHDFATALHVLIPQAEHSLRMLLVKDGVITTNIDEDGIQEEWPLGRVLAAPELTKIIGMPLVFELQSLLVEKSGANLRNRMAHGMMTSDEFGTVPAFYLWWLLLRICLVGSDLLCTTASS